MDQSLQRLLSLHRAAAPHGGGLKPALLNAFERSEADAPGTRIMRHPNAAAERSQILTGLDHILNAGQRQGALEHE